jgi:hypothetical protein
MNEPDEEELLDALRKQREAREIRRDAIEFLRARTARNLPVGVLYFVLAGIYAISSVWLDAKMEREPEMFEMILRFAVLITCIWAATDHLQRNPRDRLLLLLAEESQSKAPPISSSGKKDKADQT